MNNNKLINNHGRPLAQIHNTDTFFFLKHTHCLHKLGANVF